MSHVAMIAAARRWMPVALALALAACSGKEETPTPTAPGAAAPVAAAPAAPAVAAKVQSMGTEQLRESASQALRENRMYAPAGDNAIEYYLALRDKTPDDASVKSALTDLLPYTLIAAEQHLGREDFAEAQRLVALIEKVDASAPALPRLKEGLSKGVQVAAKRTEDETEKVKKDAEDRTEQQRLTEQRAKEAEAAKQIAAQQDVARRDSERQEAERQAAARRDAEQKQQQAAAQQANAARQAATAAAPSLRPVSTPAPRYPADALRSGTSGEVLVEITVGTDGSVTNARVLRATPSRVFDREALNAVKRWRFEPVNAPVTTRRTLVFAPGG